jgi:hypothetical protein
MEEIKKLLREVERLKKDKNIRNAPKIHQLEHSIEELAKEATTNYQLAY